MKKVSIILNIVLALAVLFFIIYAQIQTKLAEQLAGDAQELRIEAEALAKSTQKASPRNRSTSINCFGRCRVGHGQVEGVSGIEVPFGGRASNKL